MATVLAGSLLAGIGIGFYYWQRMNSFRRQMPRIFELRDSIEDIASPTAYFRDLENSLAEFPPKRRQYRDLEAELQGLDKANWGRLKADAKPLLVTRHPTRGWQPLFDVLNHAKAFNHLRRMGCTDILLIPPSHVTGQRVPDLQAKLSGRPVLCEVKTINASKEETDRRHLGAAGGVSDRLDAGFFRKLDADLAEAKAQMQAYCADPNARRIVYLVVNFDDLLHEHAERYRGQIGRHMAARSAGDFEIIFDIKSPFGSAMS